MRNTDHLTRDQLKELWSQPLSKEAAETMRKANEADRPLLAIILRETPDLMTVEQDSSTD